MSRALALIALTLLLSGCGPAPVVVAEAAAAPAEAAVNEEIAAAHLQLATSQKAAQDSVLTAQQRADAADQALAAAKIIEAAAQAEATAAHKREDAAVETARVAPLRAILGVAMAAAIVAMLLGVVEIVLIRVISLPIGSGVGYSMILAGAAVLLLSGLLEGALDHAKLLLGLACVPIGVYLVVLWAERHKLTSFATLSATMANKATGMLHQLGHSMQAEAVIIQHRSQAVLSGLAPWFDHVMADIGIGKKPAAVPALPPTPPTVAPKP